MEDTQGFAKYMEGLTIIMAITSADAVLLAEVEILQ